MTKSPDLEALARRYMDLWQDQLKGLANDRETAEVMARTLELMNAGAQAMAGMALQAAALKTDGAPGNEADARPDKPARAAGAAAGAAPAGAASGAADDGVADLARRLARLERRVAALEAGPGKGGRKPKPRVGKRKP